MKTISVREFQKHIRNCVKASQKDRVVVTRHGAPTVLLIGVDGADWETLALQTSPSFWRMIQRRRGGHTLSLDTIRKLVTPKK